VVIVELPRWLERMPGAQNSPCRQEAGTGEVVQPHHKRMTLNAVRSWNCQERVSEERRGVGTIPRALRRCLPEPRIPPREETFA
jgi:hypothetical protein